MTYDEENSEFVLCTGERFYAHAGTLGICEGYNDISYGYDGAAQPYGGRPFFDAERREIAEYMVNLWNKWGNLT
jgi:hypothetical protein